MSNDTFSELIPFLFIGGVLGLIIFITVIVLVLDKKRREAWMRVAAELGFTYVREDDGVVSHLGHFKLFQNGRAKTARNVLRGRMHQAELILTDYSYTTGSGKSKTTHTQTLCAVKSATLNLPHCFVRRENRVFDFLGKVFGGQDINFEEDPDFSKAFVLQGHDEPATRALFNSGVRQHFMQFKGTQMQFEAQGDTLLIHYGTRWKPDEIRALIDRATAFLNLAAFKKR
jgi:hypothetical protein